MVQIIRYDGSNQNIEGIKGNYGQEGQKDYSITVIKNVVFVILYNGCNVNNLKLPTVYDGFIMLSNGDRIQVKDSTFSCSLPSNVNGQGTLVLKRWN